MRVRKLVDIDARIGDARSLRIQEEIEVEIDGREAALAVLGDDPLCKEDLRYLLSRVAAFIKGVPDEEIERMTPEVRAMVADFLRTQAARFDK